MNEKTLTVKEAIEAMFRGETIVSSRGRKFMYDEKLDTILDCHHNGAAFDIINSFRKCKIYHEPLTIERLKKEAVSGETVLIYRGCHEIIFIGFLNGKIVTSGSYDRETIVTWSEEEIKRWKIKG